MCIIFPPDPELGLGMSIHPWVPLAGHRVWRSVTGVAAV